MIERLLLLLGTLVLATLAPASVGAEKADEASVHAAYVLNFIRYSEWPDAGKPADAPYVVAVLGPPETAAALRRVAGHAKAIAGRRIQVRDLALGPGSPGRQAALQVLAEGLQEAHLVFVAASHRAWYGDVVAATAGKPILTVGVGDGFVAGGGMFGLVQRRGRVTFRVNEDVIMRSRVDVSARVLVLARPAARGD